MIYEQGKGFHILHSETYPPPCNFCVGTQLKEVGILEILADEFVEHHMATVRIGLCVSRHLPEFPRGLTCSMVSYESVQII